jgi:hypothetical protein
MVAEAARSFVSMGTCLRVILSTFRGVAGALVGVAVAFAGQAEEPARPSLLTPSVVENFITSYPEVKAKVDELRARYDVAGDLSELAAWRAWAEAGGAESQLDFVVQAYEFPDFATWVRTLSVTAQAYAFAQSGADLDRKMAEALARVESDPNLPDAQKEMMRQQLLHSGHAIAAMMPSQASVDAVRPYVEQLGQLFDDEE